MPSNPSIPKNWPADIAYLTAPYCSPSLTPPQLAAIRTPPPADASPTAKVPRNLPRGPCPDVEIRPITDQDHPARGQAGLFAATRLEPGQLILPYLGEVHPGGGAAVAGEQHDGGGGGSDYDLWLSRDADVAVDAAQMGNEARFVNDYRGVPGVARPNAEFREVWDPRWRRLESGPPGGGMSGPGAGKGAWGIGVFVVPVGKKALAKSGGRAVGGINEGEEILVSYGKGFWQKRRDDETEAEDGCDRKTERG